MPGAGGAGQSLSLFRAVLRASGHNRCGRRAHTPLRPYQNGIGRRFRQCRPLATGELALDPIEQAVEDFDLPLIERDLSRKRKRPAEKLA